MSSINIAIRQIYDELFRMYGPQGWWPVAPADSSDGIPKYGVDANTVKTERQKLEIIFGTILTQNTAWANAEKAIINLNREGLVDIRKMRAASSQKIASLIRPAGYFNQKSERLKIIAKYFYDEYKGNLKVFFGRDTKKIRQELLGIKGIGPETADSILLYAGSKPVFVVDAYTIRIFSNLGILKDGMSYDEVQELFMKNLPSDAKMFNEYHALIVEHAKNYYAKGMVYKECPLYKKFNKLLSQ